MVIADGGKGATTHARHDDDAGDEDGDGDDDADNDDDEATMAATVQGGARLHQAGGVMSTTAADVCGRAAAAFRAEAQSLASAGADVEAAMTNATRSS